MTQAENPADGVRAELFRAAEAALTRLAPALPPAAADFLRRLHGAVPTAELAATPPEALAEAASSLFGFAQARRPGETRLRVLPPGPGRGATAVAEIVTDDMPFLVDSVLAALAVRGRVVRQLLHPIVPVTRDSNGALISLGQADAEALVQEHGGSVEIDCQFCNERYLFDAADVLQLFIDGSIEAPSDTRH